jgi:hypothetical protein
MRSFFGHFLRIFKPATLLRLAYVFVVACQTSPDEKLTSTSISTGNPVGLTFHFEKDAKPVAFTGTLEIYEADQIPLQGYRPKPLLRMNLENVDSVRLDTSAITGIPYKLWWDTLYNDSVWSDSLWKDSLARDTADAHDTLLEFNVVLKGDSLGVILKGFGFDTRSRRFVPSPGTDALESGGSVHAKLSKLVDYIGRLPPHLISINQNYYLFIYGTGYAAKGMGDAAKGDSLLFTLSKLPEGKHEAFLVPFYEHDHPGSSTTITTVFALESPLRTDSDALQRGEPYRVLELPDSLKVP